MKRLSTIITLALLSFSVAFTQTNYTLQDGDVTIDQNGYITSCSYDFSANTEGTNLTIPTNIGGVIIIGIGDSSYETNYNGVFQEKNITSISFPENIEYIGDNAFYYNKITSVTIPASLKNFGYNVFINNQLSSVIFEENSNLTSINSYVFYSNKITDVTIPNTITSIENSAFANNRLSNITIPASVEIIESSAFYSNQLTSVTFEENSSLIYLAESCFSGNYALTEITLPNLQQVGFAGWIGSNDIEVNSPYTITDFDRFYCAIIPYTLNCEDITLDENGYITACTNLEGNYLTIPSSLCGTTIKGISDNNVFENKYIRSLELPSTLEYIGKAAFTNNKLTKVDIPNTVKTINLVAFSGNEIKTLRFEENSNLTVIEWSAFRNNKISELTIPKSVVSIERYAFDNNEISTLSFESNSSLSSIGNGAFQDNNISMVTIPDNVLSIGNNAFFRNYITDVTFGEFSKLLTIGTNGFNQNSELTELTLPSNQNNFAGWEDESGNLIEEPYSITNFASAYHAIISHTLTCDDITLDENGYITSCADFVGTKLIIPNTICDIEIKGIADESEESNWTGIFQNRNLKSIELPSSIEYIGEDAFYNNDITNLSIPNTVARIESYAFYGNKISTIIFEDKNTLEYIGINAFRGNNLTTINIPNSITTIDDYAFSQNKLTTVNFDSNSNLKTIGFDAFRSNNITTINIPNSVSLIKDYAFNYNNLNSVLFEENSNLIQIGSNAFSNNTITELNLPLDQTGFTGWIDGNDNEVSGPPYTISDFTTMYSAMVPYTLTCDDITLDDNGYIISCSHIGGNIVIIPNTLCNITIRGIADEDDITKNGIFENRNIRKVQLPENLEVIGSNAFNKNSLTELSIPASTTTIGYSAFYSNKIINLTFEDNSNLSEIQPYSFYYNNLSSISLPENLTKIGHGSFMFNKLTNVHIPSKVTLIEDQTFYNNQLTEVSFDQNSSLSIIGSMVFINNPNLTEITLPSDQTGFNGWTDGYGNDIPSPYTIADFQTWYIADISTSIEKEVINKIKLYPNPASTQITIEGAEGETINIYNSTGVLVKQVRNISNQQSIDISMLSDGLYIVKGDKFTYKLIVK